MTPIGQWLSARPSEQQRFFPSCSDEAPVAVAEAATEDSSPIDVLVAEAMARGRAEAEALARQNLEMQLDEERRRHADQLATERLLWIESGTQELMAQMSRAVVDLETSLSGYLAQLLKPFLAQAARMRACDTFATMLQTHLAGKQVKWLRISAPGELLEKVRERLEIANISAEYSESPTCEIQAVTDTTSFETQIGKWLAAIGDVTS